MKQQHTPPLFLPMSCESSRAVFHKKVMLTYIVEK